MVRRILGDKIATTFFVNRCLVCNTRTIRKVNTPKQREVAHSALSCKNKAHKQYCLHKKWLPGEREKIDPRYKRLIEDRLKHSWYTEEVSYYERLMTQAPGKQKKRAFMTSGTYRELPKTHTPSTLPSQIGAELNKKNQ